MLTASKEFIKNTKLFAYIIGFLFIALFSYLLITRVFQRSETVKKQDSKLQVVTSFYPLSFFARQIGGDKANVITITPAGAEPHDYEPTTQDIARIEKASVLVLNGGGLEAWGDKTKVDLKNKRVEIVTAADGLATRDTKERGETMKDPHVWLDPVLAEQEAQRIAQAFIKVDPTNTAYYEANEKALERKFDALDLEFRDGLKSCQQKNIVTSHAAFGYLASRYGLKQLPIAGLSPDQEPSPKRLSEVAKFAKDTGVTYIFFETLVSPKLSQTIAKEVGAKTISFNPLEGLTPDEVTAGTDYFSAQQENLVHLRIALECK